MVVELWKSGDLKLCWKISLPKHALITTIYLYYILYVFITCLYGMFYQSSTLSLLWVYMFNFTICVISVCPSRAHNWNKCICTFWYPHHHTKFKIIVLELIFLVATTNYDLYRVHKYINLYPVSYMSLYSAFLTLVNVSPKIEWHATFTAFNVFFFCIYTNSDSGYLYI